MTTPDLPSVSVHGVLDGQPAQLFTLINSQGMTAQVSELGAHLISVALPDEEGQPVEVTLGHADFEGWCNNGPYLGATCGRFGNRIAAGRFTLGEQTYTLATNNDPAGIPCHLHGGVVGFNRKVWSGTPLAEAGRQGVQLTLTSPDGEEGYPGTLEVTVTYWLNDENELTWAAEATTDKATPVNLVNHTYWNLSGDFNTEITDHEIELNADYFLPTTPGMIPTGELQDVTGTPMDLRNPTMIADGIDVEFDAIQFGGGYDHCWPVSGELGMIRRAAVVCHPGSGRRMEVLTDQAGVQFYTGNFLDGTVHGRNGDSFRRRTGFCLETEGFPDAPNHPGFPSCILNPGQTYRHTLQVRFG